MPNATVLGAACLVLIVEPAHGQVFALLGGLLALLAVNVILMRRAFAPLTRLMALMGTIDPLRPGQRIAAPGPVSEVTLVAESFNEMLDRLETERRESARRALSAQESERRRLAAELHDEVGQHLTALVFQLSRLADGETADPRADAADAREATLGIIDDVRGLARRLRPEALDVLGLAAALDGLVRRLSEQTGLRIDLSLQEDLPALDDEAELVVYRVAQESLTNVVRHAGASRVTLALLTEADDVVLRVRDDGRGFAPSGDGHSGIRFMRERAVVLGATLLVGAAPGGGTEVQLRVPRELVQR